MVSLPAYGVCLSTVPIEHPIDFRVLMCVHGSCGVSQILVIQG